MSAEKNSFPPSLLMLRLVGELEEIGRLQVEEQAIPRGLQDSLARTVKDYLRVTHGRDPYEDAVHYWECERRLNSSGSMTVSNED